MCLDQPRVVLGLMENVGDEHIAIFDFEERDIAHGGHGAIALGGELGEMRRGMAFGFCLTSSIFSAKDEMKWDAACRLPSVLARYAMICAYSRSASRVMTSL